MSISPYRLSLWKDTRVKLEVFAMTTDMLTAVPQETTIKVAGNDRNSIFVSYDEETKEVKWRYLEEVQIRTSPLKDIKIEKEFFDEVEVLELASHTSTYPGKAININLNRNINGMNLLSFSIPKYFYIGKKKEKNELLDTFFPQAKVKLYYKNEWYSFIITNREERREGKIVYFDYSCTDMLIYELSKTGYELSFNEEHGGQGTIDELSKKILYKNGEPIIEKDEQGNIIGADWSNCEPRTEWLYLDHKDNDFIEKEEIYEKDSNGNYVFDEITGKISVKDEPVEVPISKLDDNLKRAVFRYKYSLDNGETWINKKEGRDIWGYSDIISYTPQAAKNLLSNGENFTDTSNWKSTSDYLNGVNSRTDRASVTTLVEGVWANPETPLSYNLVITPYGGEKDPWVYNESLKTSKTVLDSDTVYAIMVDFEKANSSVASTVDILIQTNSYNVEANNAKVIEQKSLSSKQYLIFTLNDKVNNPYFMIKPTIPSGADKSKYGIKIKKVQLYKVIPKDLKEISANDIASDLGLSGSGKRTKVISKSAFGNKYIFPDDEDVITNAPVEEKIKLYYYSSDTSTNPIYFEAGKNAKIEKYTESGTQKVRTLNEEKSNYYNLLQTLAELFEGWIRFNVEYYENGKIKRDKYGNQKKYIQFREVVGKNQWAGFHYGTNISSIQRTINSDEIATKIWVENSESKKNSTGIVSIADSDLNAIGESFIYDFNYYMDIGSLDSKTFINDMFGTSSEDMAFSRRMEQKKNEYNEEYKNYSALNSTIRNLKDSRISTIMQIQSNIENATINAEHIPTTWSYSGKTSADKVVVKNGIIYQGDKYTLVTAGTTYEAMKGETTSHGLGVPSADNLYNYYRSARTFAGAVDELYKSLEKINKQLGYFDEEREKAHPGTGWLCDIDFSVSNEDEEEYIKGQEGKPDPYLIKQKKSQEILDNITKERANLVRVFENKYRRFISEGTWSDNSYTDNNKYYLDAKRVAAVSGRPKISYSIDVLNLSSMPGYEIFDIDVGDKTFVCDEDFFGFDIIGKEKTLHKESFIISEINDVLDNQNESTITVQNFRTQFEDLFSRISATIQTVQTKDLIYSRGENFTANGEILVSVLQQTLLNNSLTLAQSVNQSVIISDKGIEVKALDNTAKRLRIVADGIYVTTDGGLNWTAGFQADGMNAAFITTGQINTNRVTISNEGIPSYNWDNLGITAYQTISDNGEVLPLNKSGFVRFDQHGLYLLSTPVSKGYSSTPILAGDLTNGAAYYYGAAAEKEVVVFTGTRQETNLSGNLEFRYIFKGQTQEYSLNESQVESLIYENLTEGASSADFGYDQKGNPWYMSGEMMTPVLGRTIDIPTWKDRLDYIGKKSLVSLTWRGLAINSKTGSVEIGTDLPSIRIYDNSDGNGGEAQFHPNNVARIDLGFSEKGIGAPRRKDFNSKSPERIESLYGLTLRNEYGQIVLQTNKHGSLWLAENLFIGDTDSEDGLSGTAETSVIGIQGGAYQNQGSEDSYSDYVFWSKGAPSEQTGATSYNFTIDNTGHLSANSIQISGDSSFDGNLIARSGNILGVLGIGQTYAVVENEQIYNSGFSSDKAYSLNDIHINRKYYLSKSNNEIIPVICVSKELGNYTFKDINNNDTYVLNLDEVNKKITDFYAIWAGRLFQQGEANIEKEDGPTFYITHNGELYSNKAVIKGSITADSGIVNGLFQVGLQNQIILDGSSSIPSIYNTSKTFEILGTGTINTGDLNLTKKAEIKGYVLVGNNFSLINPPKTSANGDLYDNGAVILSGNYQIYNNEENPNDPENGKNFLKKYLDIENKTGEDDTEIKELSNFIVTAKGEVTASNLNITGNSSRITGQLVLGKDNDNNKIFISSTNGIYQETDKGYKAWQIKKDGSATFENVNIRGTIEASVLKYNEIQCSSGAILVRPASKIHKLEVETQDGNEYTWIWLEDKDMFSYDISSTPFKVTVPDFLEINNVCLVQQSFGESQEIKILGYEAGIENVEGEQSIFLKLKTNLNSQFSNISIDKGYFGDLTLISLGKKGEGGLFLNSLSETRFGSGLALTVYENEEVGQTLSHVKKVVIGKLTDIPSEAFKNILSDSTLTNLEGYGLYSDNAFLKGTITTGQTGITTLLNEKNGLVLWGGAKPDSNLNEISFEHNEFTDKSDVIDFWRSSDIDKYNNLPNFFVSNDGFLFAKQGYFAGTIKSDNAEISGTIGIGGLKIGDNTGELYISYTDPELQEEIVAASFNRNGLQLFSGGDLEIYKKKVPLSDFPPTGETPYIFSDDTMEGLISQKILISELPDSTKEDYGVLIRQKQIDFVKRKLEEGVIETRSNRASALGGERKDGLQDSFLNTSLVSFVVNEEANNTNLSFNIDSSETPSIKIFKDYVYTKEEQVEIVLKTPEVNFNYGNNINNPINTVSVKSVEGGVDIFVIK